MSHAHEVDSARPTPHHLTKLVKRSTWILLALTAVGLVGLLKPEAFGQAGHWVNDTVAAGLGGVHQVASSAKQTDWHRAMKSAQEIVTEVVQPVEVLRPLHGE